MTSEERKGIGNRLKNLGKKRGETQSYIAFALCMDHTLYCKIETGKAALTLDRAHALAQYFGVSVDYLIYGKDEDLISAARQFYAETIPPAASKLTPENRRKHLEAKRYHEMIDAIQAAVQMVKVENGKKKDIVQSIFINGNDYAIDPASLQEIMEATIEIAKTTFESLCKMHDRKELKSKKE